MNNPSPPNFQNSEAYVQLQTAVDARGWKIEMLIEEEKDFDPESGYSNSVQREYFKLSFKS